MPVRLCDTGNPFASDRMNSFGTALILRFFVVGFFFFFFVRGCSFEGWCLTASFENSAYLKTAEVRSKWEGNRREKKGFGLFL